MLGVTAQKSYSYQAFLCSYYCDDLVEHDGNYHVQLGRHNAPARSMRYFRVSARFLACGFGIEPWASIILKSDIVDLTHLFYRHDPRHFPAFRDHLSSRRGVRAPQRKGVRAHA